MREVVNKNSNHIPVMESEVLKFFAPASLNVFFEGTVGAGGHAEAMLKAHPEIKRYIGCDLDPESLQLAQQRLKGFGTKVELVHSNFANLDTILETRGITEVNGFFLTWGYHRCN
jgi:16S rRNA (cytosine1402-N4)-methyltransferase